MRFSGKLYVRMRSEPGQGTVVSLYLPVHPAPSDPAVATEVAPEPARGQGECILVVDDEPGVRRFSVEALRELGYTVLDADGAAAALERLDAHPEIALLFTDVVMPEVNGRQLAEMLQQRRPGLPVVLITGYAEQAATRLDCLAPGMQLMTKPFSLELLAETVARAITTPVG